MLPKHFNILYAVLNKCIVLHQQRWFLTCNNALVGDNQLMCNCLLSTQVTQCQSYVTGFEVQWPLCGKPVNCLRGTCTYTWPRPGSWAQVLLQIHAWEPAWNSDDYFAQVVINFHVGSHCSRTLEYRVLHGNLFVISLSTCLFRPKHLWVQYTIWWCGMH